MSIDETILTQYALGILEEKEYKMVHQAILSSPTLQQELALIENSLPQLAIAENSVQASPNLRNRVLDSIQRNTRFQGFIERFATLFDLDKLNSQKLLENIDQPSDNKWENTPFPGVDIMRFSGGPLVSEATCGIVKVKPGKLFPAHQHQGDESVLVLQGIAIDDDQQQLSAGDMIQFSAGSSHSFRSMGDEVFIFAVVLQEDNKWLLMKTLMDQFRIKK